MYDAVAYANHPLRNPGHVLGGYSRKVKIKVPVPGREAEFPLIRRTVDVIGRPRNPSRWRPGNPDASPDAPKFTRQQRRRQELLSDKRKRAVDKIAARRQRRVAAQKRNLKKG